MNKYVFEDKTLNDAKEKALKELNINEENLIILSEKENKGLLKKSYVLEVSTIDDVILFIKKTLNEILKLMSIESNLEVRRRDNKIDIKIFSNNNSILIGKNGRNMKALQTIIRQIVKNYVPIKLMITIDVENYNDKRVRNLEYLAKNIAKEVANTKVETKLDNMNSFERRVIHNILSNNKYVYTISEGEEPNRHVIIKPR